MKWVYRLVEWLARTFGGLWFLLLYNVITFVWVGLGLLDPRFFDPFPSNFYTLTVSWLAINMSTLILWAEHRSKAREEEQKEKEIAQTEAILHMSESIQHVLLSLVTIAQDTERDVDDIKDAIERDDEEGD